MVIIIVDSHDRIIEFLPQLEEVVTEGLVILDDCEVIRYVGTHPDGLSGGHAPPRHPPARLVSLLLLTQGAASPGMAVCQVVWA